ncbi:MAG: ABC transporter substrate-binding protein [Deltaproteobacteria bacterium]|jgi:polar amino acid transport system substrate-binding protein|nr:ABC transporter substrate-binding protein [Deltaproteobacteria bacterium]
MFKSFRLKGFASLCLTLLLGVALAGSALAEEKVYINGIDASYPPFAFIDTSGQAAGFDVDSMNWIANKMGFKVKHEAMDWSSIVTSLLGKRIDMVCSGMSISPERKAVVTFSEPYFSIRKYLLVHNDSNFTREEVLNGNLKLGVQGGTNEALWLEENKAPNKWNYSLRYYASPPMAIEDLVNKRIDAAAIDSAPANDAIGKQGKPVKIVGEFAEGDDFGVATRNEDTELRNTINEGYRLLKADPYWEELKAKYELK